MINESIFSKKSKETNIFTRCLSTLNIEEIKKLLVHYFVKNVDLKESGQETDDIIAELDVSKLINISTS